MELTRKQSVSYQINSSGHKLFLILDLNGVLCHCTSSAQRSGRLHVPSDLIYDENHPTIVGPKVVRVRPGVREFLSRISEVAYLCIWSSMKLNTVELIIDFLFEGLRQPCLVLGQESCHVLHDEKGDVVLKNSAGPRGSPQFLKYLSKVIWSSQIPLYGCLVDFRPMVENTLLIDDSPPKSVLNPPGNAIFPVSWNPFNKGDTFLLRQLAPYLLEITSRLDSIPHIVGKHRIGQSPLHHKSNLYKSLRAYAQLNGLID